MTDSISRRADDPDRQADWDDGLGAEAGPVDWPGVVAALVEAEVPPPPEALGWPQDWYRVASHCFASWRAVARPYDFDAVMAEAYGLGEARVGLLGFDGYGFNSWAMHAIWRRGPLLVGFQSAAGGAFMDAEASHARIAASWEVLGDMAAALARLEGEGKLPAGRTLVVIDSDLHESRWGWLAQGTAWDAADWTSSAVAAMAALAELEQL